MEDEQSHARTLADRIYALGGVPSTKMTALANFTDSIDEALKQDIDAEKEAVELYQEIVRYCDKVGDIATSMVVEDILMAEVHHLDEFVKLLRSSAK